MPTPRTGHFPQTPIKWSSGDLFNGFCLIAFVPSVGYSETDLGLIDPTDRLPQFANVPIQNGLLNSSLGLYFNADISPPASTYTASFYDTTKKLIAGPGSPFTVTTDPISLTIPTLTVPTSGGTAPTPDTGSDVVPGPPPIIINSLRPFTITGVQNSTDGTDGNDTFTLNFTPVFLILVKNGQGMKLGLSYTYSGNVITFLSPYKPLPTDTLDAYGQI